MADTGAGVPGGSGVFLAMAVPPIAVLPLSLGYSTTVPVSTGQSSLNGRTGERPVKDAGEQLKGKQL